MELSYGVSSTSEKKIYLRSGIYFLFIQFLQSSAQNTSCFTLFINYEVCPEYDNKTNTYFGGSTCSAIHELPSGVISVPKNSFLDFFARVRKFIGYLKFYFDSRKSNIDLISDCNANLTVKVRRGNVAYDDEYDVEATCESDGRKSVTFYAPQPDIYFFSFKNNAQEPTTTNSTIEEVDCKTEAYGKNCTTVDSGNDLTTQDGKPIKKTASTDKPYDFYVVKSSELLVGVGVQRKNDKDNTDAPDLLASVLNLPSNDSFILRAAQNQVNLLWATAVNSTNQWFIAVPSVRDYYIWANVHCPNNCSNHGNCEKTTGVCTCEKHYKKTLFCDKKSFPVIWIVLIAIACAIILAVAIGVPVACYVKNKNKARYERV